jgi:hypothetical protein
VDLNFKKIALATLLATNLYSYNGFEVSVGVHDFIVSDIEDDKGIEDVKSGTSHTFGTNLTLSYNYTTESNINFYANLNIYADVIDIDKLDPDHIPVWFDYLIDIKGPIYNINQNNTINWLVNFDNKQNTVSSVEREIRQHLGIGWNYNYLNFKLALNAYVGFYYIEIDDDIPLDRGYNRIELDDGEESKCFELKFYYEFLDVSTYFKIKQYSTTAGFEELETDYEFLATYKNISFLNDGGSLNLKIKYNKYNFDRFNIHELDVLPWDNDMLIKAYVSVPFSF